MFNDDVSIVRLNALRVVYFLNFAFLGANVWPLLISPAKPIEPMTGVAFAFFAAFSTLCALGVRYPLKMLPVLWVQLLYKSVWLLAVALPLWSARQWTAETASMVRVFVAAVIVDALVIPWPYVVAKFGKAPGDPWTRTPSPSGRIGAAATGVAKS
jgi:hypothetical protein